MYLPQGYEFPWKTEEEFKTYLLLNHPQALAYAWIEAYAKNLSEGAEDYSDEYGDLSISAGDLISTAIKNIGLPKTDWPDYLSRGPLLEGVGVDPTFWTKLSIFLDVPIPSKDRNSFFTCYC